MNPEQQRVAIAEWCGWTQIIDKSALLMMDDGFHVVGYPPVGAIIGKKQPLPDYLHDLNAIHEAEKGLTEKQISTYVGNMWRAMHLSPEAAIGTIHATAAQRSESLLRTLNLWKD